MSVRKNICQVFDSSTLDEGLTKIYENFDDLYQDKSEHFLNQD